LEWLREYFSDVERHRDVENFVPLSSEAVLEKGLGEFLYVQGNAYLFVMIIMIYELKYVMGVFA